MKPMKLRTLPVGAAALAAAVACSSGPVKADQKPGPKPADSKPVAAPTQPVSGFFILRTRVLRGFAKI